MNSKFKNIIIIILVILLAVSAFFLYRNSQNNNNNDIVDNNNGDNDIVDNNNNNNNNNEDVITQGEIKDLDISLKYGLKEIDIEYDIDKNGRIEAKVEDEINNVRLVGEEAAKYIEDNFLSINYKNPQSDIVSEVLSVLNLAEDFNELDIEVEYADFTKEKIEIIQ